MRHIPHRVASTTAAVDAESIARRPCFLCPENLDPEESGLAFGDYTLYCNPFPVVDRHLTIVHRQHRPQRIEGQVGALLDLAEALAGFFVIYNGPECGASAPDHMHLQAGLREGLPIVRDASTRTGPALEIYGGRALLFRGRERSRLVELTGRALAALSSVTGRSPEPWCNAAVFHDPRAGFSLIFIPRGKHRPEAFHTGALTVSPAAIDLCGLLVAPVLSDFERITGEDVVSVFREVCLPEDQFRDLVGRLEAP